MRSIERLWGLSSGLLDQSDIDQVAAAIEPGSLAGILVYENVWAVPMWTAIDRSSARLVGAGRIRRRRPDRRAGCDRPRAETAWKGTANGTVEDGVESGRGGEDG